MIIFWWWFLNKKTTTTRKQLITGRGTVSFQQVMLFHLMRRRDGRGLVRFRFNSDSTSFIRVLRSSQVGWIDCVHINGGTEDSSSDTMPCFCGTVTTHRASQLTLLEVKKWVHDIYRSTLKQKKKKMLLLLIWERIPGNCSSDEVEQGMLNCFVNRRRWEDATDLRIWNQTRIDHHIGSSTQWKWYSR